MLTHQVSIGSGFGLANGSGIRIGLAAPEESYFLNARALINNRWMIQGIYMNTNTDHSGEGHGNFFSLGLSYRIPAMHGPIRPVSEE